MFWTTSKVWVVCWVVARVAVVKCKIHSNSELQGSTKTKNHHDMPLNWHRALRVLSCYGLNVNSLVGVLPRSGVVQDTMEVQNFNAKQNRFAGTLPDGGMQAMLAVTNFDIAENSFTGIFPESGLRE
eukprot:998255-Amphidinium_carterae.1